MTRIEKYLESHNEVKSIVMSIKCPRVNGRAITDCRYDCVKCWNHEEVEPDERTTAD